MTVTINETLVTDYIDAYQTDAAGVEVREKSSVVPAADFDEYVAHAREGYIGGGYAWVTRTPDQVGPPSETFAGGDETRERVLLILPRGDTHWGIPGGGVEAEEFFEEAATREVREEAGITCAVTGVWLLEHRTWESDDESDDRCTHTLHVYFDADYVEGSITIQGSEVNGAAWFAEPPNRVLDPIQDRAASFF